MFTIKKIYLDNKDSEEIETIFRKFSVRKGNMLQFANNPGFQKIDKKLFFANETNDFFRCIRIRYPLENFLPKLILKIDKKDFRIIEIKYGFFSFLYLAFLISMILLFLYFIVFKIHFEGGLDVILVFLGLQLTATFIEYKLTLRTIHKILKE